MIHTVAARPRSQATRLLHLTLLLAVLFQLASSQFIYFPMPGDPPTLLFTLHEYLGLTSIAILGAFWLWTLIRHGETRLGRLIPWFSAPRLRAVWGDARAQLRRLARFQAPDDADGALASAVHGLGLLAVSAMVLTGTVFFVARGTPLSHIAMSGHKLIANLVWAYLFAHAGLAILHHLLGSDIFARMFWPRHARPERTPAE